MHAGTLYQLHDAGNEHLFAVADGVHFNLLADVVLIYQHRLVRIHSHRVFQIVSDSLFVGDNLHGPSAQHEAGTNENRIADALRCLHAILNACYGFTRGVRNVQADEHLLEGIPVLGTVDGFAVGADQLHAALRKRFGEIDGGLSAEGCDYTDGLFQIHDIGHFLQRQRFKVELIGAGIVGGYGFGVVVDNDGLIAGFPNGADGVNSGIIELHTLADADWTGAKDDNFFSIGYDGFIFRLIGGIEVRHIAVELASAGINHLIDRKNAAFPTHVVYIILADLPELRDVSIRKAHSLGFPKHIHNADGGFQFPFKINDILDLIEEKHVNLGDVADSAVIHAFPHQLSDGIDTVVGAVFDIVQQFVGGHVFAVELGHMQMTVSGFQRTNGFEQTFLHGTANAHHLTGRFHLR